MAKSKLSIDQQAEIKRIMKKEGVVRETAIRRLFGKKATSAITKSKPKSKRKPKTPSATAAQASKNRAEGLRLFALARRPTEAQFISVYGKRGHLMTWDQREAAGIPAKNFQAALTEKGASRPSKGPGRKKSSWPTRTTKKSARTTEATANATDEIPAAPITEN